MSVHISDRTSPRIGEASGATLVLPIGATEQHGPHLPVFTDALVVGEVARCAAQQVTRAGGPPLAVAPTMPFGSSHHHLPRAGTLSVRSTTLLAALGDLLDSAVTYGVRSLVLLNGHGGNQDIVHQAARDLALRHHVRVAATSYWTPAWDKLVACAQTHGIGPVPGHAGSFETSLVWHLRPDLIDQAAIPDAPVVTEWDTTPMLAKPVVEEYGWVHEMGGYTDRSSMASAAIGKELFDTIVTDMAAFLTAFATKPGGTDGAVGR